MIASFKCDETAKIFLDEISTKLPREIQRTAKRKLAYIDDVTKLSDLYHMKGNHMEKLKGKRRGQYSLRINRQWRICFEWEDGDAYEVEIIDYH